MAIAKGAPKAGHGETLLAFGMGRTTRNCDERVLIAKRGRPERASASVRSVFFAPAGRHSEKPDRFYQLAEQLCGEGPRAELFARQRRKGWVGFGDEIPEEVTP
jgi:N6-adenosine-specific RNA methylase IME4